MNPLDLHREVKCHEFHNRLQTIVCSTNSNPSKTSLPNMQDTNYYGQTAIAKNKTRRFIGQ